MTTATLVDTNVFIDILGPETEARGWSVGALGRCHAAGPIVISPIVWSELAFPAVGERALSTALAWLGARKEAIPFEAAYKAGLAHKRYRERGGGRERTLPDFLLGAHADHQGYTLLTRDAGRYRSYFPELALIAPEDEAPGGATA